MKHLLQETYQRTKKMTGIDARSPQNFRQILAEPSSYNVYSKSLAEGLNDQDHETFMMLAENTRVSLMENSMFQLNPYETLTVPILRVFYPKLIAKELVNVMPIDKPEVIKGFLRAYFKKFGDAGYNRVFPDVNSDVSSGPSVGVDVTKSATVGTTDILAEVGLTSANSHVEQNFRIVGVTDSTANQAVVSIESTIDGTFSAAVQVAGQDDVISGNVDFLNGTLTWSSATGVVTSVDYQAICSLEENQINPTVKFDIEKIRLVTNDRRISAEWSINIEQDAKALYDVSVQSEFINIIGEQIAVDIDREIVGSLIASNNALNPVTHKDTFDLKPAVGFSWGRKAWYENVIPKLNSLSAQVYNSSLMGPANTLACNPLDSAVLESLNSFEYAGTAVEGGDLGYRTATVAGGKWKVLVSSIVPQGKILLKYRSAEMQRAVFCYAPYVPALLTPYPIGTNPSLTIMSRYASKMIRPEGLAVLNIVDTGV